MQSSMQLALDTDTCFLSKMPFLYQFTQEFNKKTLFAMFRILVPFLRTFGMAPARFEPATSCFY